MVKTGTLQKPRVGQLQKPAPLASNQLRCSCGQVFTANAEGEYIFPAAHAGHIFTYAYRPTAQADQPTDPQADATDAAARVGQNLQQTPCPVCGGKPVAGMSTIYHKPGCTQYQRA